jgi:regulator of CtrA degradation
MSKFMFLKSNYDETVHLLQQCSNYLETHGRRERVSLSLEDLVLYTAATSHITVPLTSVLSWLMAWKAVEAGEISSSELLNSRYRLQDIESLPDEQLTLFVRLPQPIPNLVEASTRLYQRMCRLERDMSDSSVNNQRLISV